MDDELKRRWSWFQGLGGEFGSRALNPEHELDRMIFLLALADMDAEAALAFRVMAREIPDDAVARKLDEFSKDHERHLWSLDEYLSRHGLRHPGSSALDQCSWASLASSMTGLHAAFGFVALQSAELFTNTLYGAALRLVPEARELIARNLEDERRHAQWLASWLAENWQPHDELEGASVPVSYVRDIRPPDGDG